MTIELGHIGTSTVCQKGEACEAWMRKGTSSRVEPLARITARVVCDSMGERLPLKTSSHSLYNDFYIFLTMSSVITTLTSCAEKVLLPPTLDADSHRKALQDSSWADVCRGTRKSPGLLR